MFTFFFSEPEDVEYEDVVSVLRGITLIDSFWI